MLTIIAAASENNALGKDNQLVWHLPDDFKRFKSLTSGHYIVMGRKTFESFPKPLPNRTHIIITRQKDYEAPEGAPRGPLPLGVGLDQVVEHGCSEPGEWGVRLSGGAT